MGQMHTEIKWRACVCFTWESGNRVFLSYSIAIYMMKRHLNLNICIVVCYQSTILEPLLFSPAKNIFIITIFLFRIKSNRYTKNTNISHAYFVIEQKKNNNPIRTSRYKQIHGNHSFTEVFVCSECQQLQWY